MKWIDIRDKMPEIGRPIMAKTNQGEEDYSLKWFEGCIDEYEGELRLHHIEGGGTVLRLFNSFKWFYLDESHTPLEPMFTEADMILFANFCGSNSNRYKAGEWFTRMGEKGPETSLSTKGMFGLFQSLIIPSLPVIKNDK